jgi:demethylmenaquinone methyltransferase / 2-methoxy-6-polyprenyl-1,4-benzoquinol methylase
MPSTQGEQTDFGFRTVDLDAKQAMVDDIFHTVARRYDLMNDLMSGGLHRVWKDIMVTALNPPRDARPFAVIDVAGGTGDVAFRIAAAGGAGTQVTVCDINPDMLAVGRARAEERAIGGVAFVAGNAEALPFPDKSFDACTIAFGIRNVPRIAAALGEFFRVLRPGGRFLCLEFSVVDVPGLAAR